MAYGAATATQWLTHLASPPYLFRISPALLRDSMILPPSTVPIFSPQTSSECKTSAIKPVLPEFYLINNVFKNKLTRIYI
jgi:hypothetical protein